MHTTQYTVQIALQTKLCTRHYTPHTVHTAHTPQAVSHYLPPASTYLGGDCGGLRPSGPGAGPADGAVLSKYK